MNSGHCSVGNIGKQQDCLCPPSWFRINNLSGDGYLVYPTVAMSKQDFLGKEAKIFFLVTVYIQRYLIMYLKF